ncbi:hypothetical protein [Streptomyces nigrescens]|uniref:hypothetical protein n=1 Tax=Streptomyces nigrescens TaxID=1920 RepID=UPI0036FA87F0
MPWWPDNTIPPWWSTNPITWELHHRATGHAPERAADPAPDFRGRIRAALAAAAKGQQ